MGSMNLVEYRSDIRTELSDSATFFSDTEIDRAVEKTEALLARLIPKKNVFEATYDSSGSETLTIATNTGTLSQIPVKYDSETLVNDGSGETEVRNTDYTINYQTGVVTEIGSLLADGAYTATYTVDPKRIDLTTNIPDPIKITRIEYPVGDQPPTYLGGYDWVFNTIILHGNDLLGDGRNYRIYYDSKWIGATASVDGDYPEHLDDAVVIGAAGQVLIIKAEKYVQSSVTELELVNAAADSMATPLADINVDLDKVALYLETNDTTDNAKDVLANISDDINALRTAISTALDLSSTYLTNANTDPSAKFYLTTGDDKIITVNVADNVAENYANYARTSIQIYNSLIAEANIRLSNLRSYIEEAAGWTEMGDTFIKEATQRIAEVNAWSVQADKYRTTSQEYLNIAGRYLASGQAKINEFYVMLGFKPEIRGTQSSSGQASLY